MKTFKSFTALPPKTLASQAGYVGVVCGDRTTRWESAACIATITPPGSMLKYVPASGGRLPEARNSVVEEALSMGAAWVFFVDDDQVFQPDLLQRLLKHNVDIVTPLILKRQPPYEPIFAGLCPVSSDMSDAELRDSWANTYAPGDVSARGLVEVGHCGTGATLIKADVFRALPQPWFQWGKCVAAGGGEDTWFTLCARRAGFKVWCDMNTHIGHLTTAAVWPVRRMDGGLDAEVRTVTTDLYMLD